MNTAPKSNRTWSFGHRHRSSPGSQVRCVACRADGCARLLNRLSRLRVRGVCRRSGSGGRAGPSQLSRLRCCGRVVGLWSPLEAGRRAAVRAARRRSRHRRMPERVGTDNARTHVGTAGRASGQRRRRARRTDIHSAGRTATRAPSLGSPERAARRTGSSQARRCHLRVLGIPLSGPAIRRELEGRPGTRPLEDGWISRSSRIARSAVLSSTASAGGGM